MEENNLKKPEKSVYCNACNLELPPDTKFCTECGKPVEDSTAQELSPEKITCPKCQTEVQLGTKFCTECGAKIEDTAVNNLTCPQCHAEAQPGARFCMECGTSLEGVKSTGNVTPERPGPEPDTTTSKKDDDPLDAIAGTGKDIMKNVGGLFDKAASSIDSSLNKGKSSKSKDTSEELEKPRVKKVTHPGYLVCDKCGGYYELAPGETADDFSDECECGGKLKHHQKLPETA